MAKSRIAKFEFPEAVYVRSVEIYISTTKKHLDLANPSADVKYEIVADCMDHKKGRQTTSVRRTLELKNGELFWSYINDVFKCMNYNEVLAEVKKVIG